ncbi:GGDEF domain-containing protein [Hoeflea sp.]|uniref:GGDEF domain-containing protein n=1 Tax=Hoeflea sp. TaxID=1940281 RepID=UPI003B516B86
MRFLDLWNPFTFVGREIASQQKFEETVAELYNPGPHVTATLGLSLAALSATLTGTPGTALSAVLIMIAYIALRLFMWNRFGARTARDVDSFWVRTFVFGSLLSGLAWGVSGALLIYNTAPETQILTLAVTSAILQGAAGRAYMMPGTALANISIVIGIMSASALATGHYVFVPAFILYFFFLRSFILKMIDNRLRQLEAEQTAARLLGEITEKNQLLRLANDALAAKAYADSLTGIANRRKFDLYLTESLARAGEESSALSLLMIDVDHFKSFNDTYGHQAGDECLQRVCKAITGIVADDRGLVARYGGEEFVVVLPGFDLAASTVLAERICIAVRLTSLDDLPNSPPRQTVSIGLASLETVTEASSDAMLAAADTALYKAKKAGRDRVCVHSGPVEQRPALAR